jgi:hypothetical protein
MHILKTQSIAEKHSRRPCQDFPSSALNPSQQHGFVYRSLNFPCGQTQAATCGTNAELRRQGGVSLFASLASRPTQLFSRGSEVRIKGSLRYSSNRESGALGLFSPSGLKEVEASETWS